ncbi:MAG TPA: NAD-dependent succinate-semialdehyde dehydrogenase [Methylocella sp.]|nr:NAD-dependent succinate-semialdehyde dehydrogenase [Methylocella sp.]
MSPGLKLLRDQAFIGGQWRASTSGRRFEVKDPAAGSILASVADCSAEDAAAAVEAAAAAFANWKQTPGKERARLLRRWFELITQHAEELAEILAREEGKPFAEAKAEIAYGASFAEWFSEEARRIYGDIVLSPRPGREILVLKEPAGVAAAITPWNFPNAMITRKIAPALAAGCTTVVKPAEETPLSALALGVLAQEAGLPDGTLNILPSARAAEIGLALTTHPLVRKVSFTGSTEVGRLIMRQSAGTVKKISLELGGNAPFIVFSDADLDAAVAGAIASKFRNSGQTCVCPNRFYVQSGIYGAFAEKFAKAASALKAGSPFEPGVQLGPLISPQALAKVESLVADALAKGAKALTGACRHPLGGTFYTPTVLIDVPQDARLLQEEIFGPVAALAPFETEEEAVALANASEYGLASYVYTRDTGRAFRMARAIEAGMVGVNEAVISTAEAPFGGVKQSGTGREGSRYGIEEFLEIKYVCMGGI